MVLALVKHCHVRDLAVVTEVFHDDSIENEAESEEEDVFQLNTKELVKGSLSFEASAATTFPW